LVEVPRLDLEYSSSIAIVFLEYSSSIATKMRLPSGFYLSIIHVKKRTGGAPTGMVSALFVCLVDMGRGAVPAPKAIGVRNGESTKLPIYQLLIT